MMHLLLNNKSKSYIIPTKSVIQTRCAQTRSDSNLTIRPSESNVAKTSISVNEVKALSTLTRIRHTLINLHLAIFPSKS